MSWPQDRPVTVPQMLQRMNHLHVFMLEHEQRRKPPVHIGPGKHTVLTTLIRWGCIEEDGRITPTGRQLLEAAPAEFQRRQVAFEAKVRAWAEDEDGRRLM